ncbi:MAG: peptidylprolyl isomerase [Candidatus Sulfotelmatobacter sp.]|jgi:parvulin-like peptidyl-prolyl cis-trans isomerase-like protein
MRKSWLLCVFLGGLAWGQAQPGTMAAQPAPAQAASASPKATPEEVPLSAVVITIKGVCPAVPKTAAASKTAAGKPATAPAKKPADCKTEITRAQFEKIASALQPGPNPLNAQQKHQLAAVLPRFIAMSDQAKAKGLDKTERFEETMKFLRMQVLTRELDRTVQEQADNVPQAEIDDYYKKNPEAFEQFSLDRLFIPRFKQTPPENKEEGKASEKLTEEQQKAKEAADQAKREQGEQEMNKLADTLRARAASGEDFVKLQKEAFEASGTKVENPTVNLPKVRRTGLPPAHAAVFDLKVGEVSQVISDNGGHYIYKVVTEEVLPLDDALKTEIHNKLKSERQKELMDKYTNSFQATTNEAYFGPPGPAGGRPPGQLPPHNPRPQMAPPPAPSQTQPQGGPPPATAPPSNPN